MNAKTSTRGLSSTGDELGEAFVDDFLVVLLEDVVFCAPLLLAEDFRLARSILCGVTVAFDSFEPLEL